MQGDYTPPRNRIASLGKKIMDGNSLQTFYDQIMSTTQSDTSNSFHFEKIQASIINKRQSIYDQSPGFSRFSSESKYKKQEDKNEDQIGKIIQSLEQRYKSMGESKPLKLEQTKAGGGQQLKTQRDQLNQLQDKYNLNKSQKKMLDSKVIEIKLGDNKKVMLESIYTNGFISKYNPTNKNLVENSRQLSFYSFPITQYQNPLESLAQQKQASVRSFDQRSMKEIVFIKPVVYTKQQARKRLKKCMLAVYYVCCQIKAIKSKINQRKSRYNPIFQGVIVNVIQHTKKTYLSILTPVISKIKDFTNQKSAFNHSTSYLIHFHQILKILIKTFSVLRTVLMQDKYTRNIMKLLVKQRQHIPDHYLTLFELARIQMSRMFGYTIKTESTCNILLITFIFIRVILLEIFAFPLRLQPDFIINPAWKKIVNDLRCIILMTCLELIEEEESMGKFEHMKGNWAWVHKDMKYKFTGSFYVDVQRPDDKQLISHQWDMNGAKIFKDKMPNSWELLKDEIGELCGQIYDQLKETDFVDLKSASKSSKRTISKR